MSNSRTAVVVEVTVTAAAVVDMEAAAMVDIKRLRPSFFVNTDSAAMYKKYSSRL